MINSTTLIIFLGPLLVALGVALTCCLQLRRELKEARAELAENDYSKLLNTAKILRAENKSFATELAAVKNELNAKDQSAIYLQTQLAILENDIAQKHAVASRFERRVQKQKIEIERLERAVIDLETECIAQGLELD